MTIGGIISAIVIGLIIGALGRLIVPGKQDIPIWLTIIIGIVAALIGTAIVGSLRDTNGIDWVEIIVQVARLMDGSRKVTHVSEVTGFDADTGKYSIQDLFVRRYPETVKAAERRRQEIETLAQADKFRLENEGHGRASAIRSVGEAEASAIKAKSDALEGDGADKQLMQTVMLRLADAFEAAKVPLVPQIQLGAAEQGNAFGTLLALMSSLKAQELARRE